MDIDANFEFIEADLESLQSIQQAAKYLRKRASSMEGKKIRCLVNNAGIWPNSLRLTNDGLESAFQVNHLSHFLLTRELIPNMALASRVVTTSSLAHAFEADRNSIEQQLNDVNWERSKFSSNANYGRSKLYNLLFARQLAVEMEKQGTPWIKSIAIHPGVVATQLFRELLPSQTSTSTSSSIADDYSGSSRSFLDALVSSSSSLILKSPEEGARTLIYAAVAPQVVSGSYMVDCEQQQVSPAGRDYQSAQKLWDLSTQLLDEKLAAAE
eukprot:jgi/Bigna1/91380/estExt_fgenesh1_pg.C_990005